MKKLLYIITRIEKSGPNRVLENMLTGINNKKYKLYILSLFDNKEEVKKYPNVEYLCLNLNSVLDVFTKGKKLIKNLEKELNPDIVHSHGILPDYLNTFFEKAYRLNTLHCNIFEDYKYSYSFLKAFLMIQFHTYSLKRLDKVVCCSKAVYNEISKIGLKNLTYVENGIKDEPKNNITNIKKELHINNEDIVYIYIGNLSKRKNVLKLVDLFLKNISNNEHLVILGNGELKKYMDDISKNAENIHILGFRKNTYDYLSIADVYVSASLSEGLSISVIEALSHGLLLLLSNIESHKEFFDKDETYLGEYFTENDFKIKLDNIRNNVRSIDKKKIIRYKNNYFSDKSMMKKYEVLYEDRK